ncbi:septum formation family protein [Micromonospora zhanjiangensis]
MTVLLTGCGPSAGNTAGTPTSAPPPSPFVPAAGTCHATVEPIAPRNKYAPVDCAGKHRAETAYVGTFTGPDADRGTPPSADQDADKRAFQGCGPEATKYLGADWRGGLLTIQVVVPGADDWTAGSRWYRCDLVTVQMLDIEAVTTEHTGSLRGEFTHTSPLALGCFNQDKKEKWIPQPCTKPHRFEYVGIWSAPEDTYQTVADKPEPVMDHCRVVIAAYTGNAEFGRDAGVWFQFPPWKAWALGDHAVRCLYWNDERDETFSLKHRFRR